MIDQLGQANATRIIFQYEQYPDEQSIEIATYIKDLGMQVGVCLAPDTDIQNNESIQLLLSKKYSSETMSSTDSKNDNIPLVDMVDIYMIF